LPQRHRHSPRLTAITILDRLEQTRQPVKMLLDRETTRHPLPARERGLIMEIVYGVLRHRQSLDRIVELVSTTRLDKLDPFIHQALRVGLYQLFHLDRIPSPAAVNETVESCKAAGKPKRLQGFANAILREALRRQEDLAVAAATDRFGQTILNHPQWLVNRWRKRFGEAETRRICASNNRLPSLVLRQNNLVDGNDTLQQMLATRGIASLAGAYSPDAICIPHFSGSISQLPGYPEGLFLVQDEAAQLTTPLLGPFRQGGRYLDACAGLGGKTSHLLLFAGVWQLQIDAVEPEQSRRDKLGDNLVRLFGTTSAKIHPVRLENLEENHLSAFDGILVDAPCSGTGVTGRHPDIRWNRREEDLLRYQEEQLALLHHAFGMLRPGGVLVYATCSLEREENEDVVARFLTAHRAMNLTDCTPYLPPAAHHLVADGFFSPHPDETIDGFFAARMQRS